MTSDESVVDPVAPLAEEFVARFRRGERPALSEYIERCPGHAEKIKQLFPMLVVMEQAGSGTVASGAGEPSARLEHVSGYRILREVGRGGMGVVYEAEQESLGRRVALKVLPLHSAGDGQALERFRREARAAARLHHTNIIPVYEVGEENGLCFYAMQFIQGQPLDTVIEELKKARQVGSSVILPGSDPSAGTDRRPFYRAVARIGVQAAEALDYAHREGVIHRDVKPSNLLLDAEGRVWVADFGLAKVAGSSLTQTGDVVGTLRYVPPERFGGWADPRSDVYSLGLTLYELLTLRPAFEAPDQFKLIQQVMHDEPVRPGRLDPSVPRDLETIVLKAIDKEPSRRYQTAGALAEDLRLFAEDRPIRARRLGPAERTWRWCRRNPALAVLVAAVILVAGVGFAATWSAGRRAAALAEERRRDLYVARIRQAGEAARQVGGRGRLQQLLKETLPQPGETDLRGWEWYYLNSLLQQPNSVVSFHAHDGGVLSAAWSPDGRELATAGQDDTVKLWDRTGRLLRPPLRGHEAAVTAVAWNHAGDSLASVSLDGSIRFWDPKTGKSRAPGPLQSSEHPLLSAVNWHPDGDRLVTAADDGNLAIWDARTGKRIVENLPGKRQVSACAAYSPDRRRLAAGSDHLFLFDHLDMDQPGLPTTLLHPGWVLGVSWSPDGKRLASSVRNSHRPTQAGALPATTIKTWDAATGRALQTFYGHTAEIPSVNWHPSSRWLVSADAHGLVKVWDADAGTDLGTVQEHDSPATWAGWSPDGEVLASTSGNGRVTLQPGQTPATDFNAGPDEGIGALAWAPDGKELAWGDHQGRVVIWDVANQQRKRVLTGHTQGVQALAWSPDGKRLASAGEEGTVKVWDAATGQLPLILRGRLTSFLALAWSLDGKLAVAGADQQVEVWDADSGRSVKTFQAPGSVLALTWNPDGQRLAAVGVHPVGVRVWDIPNGSEQSLLTNDAVELGIGRVAWSRDGNRLAASGKDVYVWDLKAKGPPIKLKVPTARALWWDEGDVLATVGVALPDAANGQGPAALKADERYPLYLRAWDAARGQLKSEVRLEPADEQYPTVFRPDGRAIASGTTSGDLVIWNAATGKATRSGVSRNPGSHVGRWSPDGKLLATAIRSVVIRDAATMEVRTTFPNLGQNIFAVSWHPDGGLVASGGLDQSVRIWDTRTGKELAEDDKHKATIGSVEWHHDGKRLVSAGWNGTVIVWKWDGKALGVEHEQECQKAHEVPVRWSPDGRFLAAPGPNRTVRIWDSERGYLMREITGHQAPVSALAWSPAGRWLASGDTTGAIRVWDADSGTRLRVLDGHRQRVLDLSWSPDGKRLASGAYDATARIWDPERGAELLVLEGKSQYVADVNWDPDGKRLALNGIVHDATGGY